MVPDATIWLWSIVIHHLINKVFSHEIRKQLREHPPEILGWEREHEKSTSVQCASNMYQADNRGGEAGQLMLAPFSGQRGREGGMLLQTQSLAGTCQSSPARQQKCTVATHIRLSSITSTCQILNDFQERLHFCKRQIYPFTGIRDHYKVSSR